MTKEEILKKLRENDISILSSLENRICQLSAESSLSTKEQSMLNKAYVHLCDALVELISASNELKNELSNN